MIQFSTLIQQFAEQGEKTGWTYIFIPGHVAQQVKPGKKGFRIKGLIDQIKIEGMSLLPMGEGDFILSLNAGLRKKLGKHAGAMVSLQFEEDKEFKVEMPEDLRICLADEKGLLETFLKQAQSHQDYFINWINTAKTEETRTKRLVSTVNAIARGFNYGEMIRFEKRR